MSGKMYGLQHYYFLKHATTQFYRRIYSISYNYEDMLKDISCAF
jgi:hypothetical protein